MTLQTQGIARHDTTHRDIRKIAYVSFQFIGECADRFRRQGIDGLKAEPRAMAAPVWLRAVVRWLTDRTPEHFGYFRTRWSCETLAEVLAWEKGIRKSAETIRRGLRDVGFVWRRPRPVLERVDPDFTCKYAKIQELLQNLPDNETAVFQDEVDVHLNPKIGSCWMPKGEQAEVVTPGNNVNDTWPARWCGERARC